ncbi:MAG: DUF4013 domain-containing protein [Methanobrevibacter sp.]|uniref:DUF4013 domain-containing protein n=1 Tax=Methanobrevibacter sp. TaxID=66852 RepID=UPI0025F5CB43|nr:DUF4013 domain-containing protein [Methanobrevibacter sp.]MBE6508762.1 DUF4013 domain-containing protein [Methanobrevibacter sp.]
MASITDCVVEGLKYPFNDLKKLLGFGALFALMSVLSTYIGLKSFDIFRDMVHIAEMTNGTVSKIPFSQLPAGDINIVLALAVLSFIVSLFILGYQYDILKFSIDKKSDLPGFSDIIGMLTKGIKYFIVTLAYNIIPMLVLAGGVVLLNDSSALLFVMLIAGLLFIIAYFLMIMALNNMVDYDSLKKAFDFREITDKIANLGWGKYIGIIIFTLIVMMIISVAVSFILSFITVGFAAAINNQAVVISFVIAIIEGLFIDSYMALFFNRVCGLVYREAIK